MNNLHSTLQEIQNYVEKLEAECAELLKQNDAMKQHITTIAKTVGDIYELKTNKFLYPYDDEYIEDVCNYITGIPARTQAEKAH